ncbi:MULTISPECIES: hypothetical protein [Xanthomonas]|nr:hypothetical protein [Xanthomonas cannabis]
MLFSLMYGWLKRWNKRDGVEVAQAACLAGDVLQWHRITVEQQ